MGNGFNRLYLQAKNLQSLAMLVCLSACSTSEGNQPAALPTVIGMDAETVTKPKKELETPTGVKQVYDPAQDMTVRTAFRGLMQARQEAGYFKGWSKHLTYRSNTYEPTIENKANWNVKVESNPQIKDYIDLVTKAHRVQYYDYRRSGCVSADINICYNPARRYERSPFTFISCGPAETNWGDVQSRCEFGSIHDLDFLAVSPKLIPKKPQLKDKSEDFCFDDTQIGDPKRGGFNEQFEQFFRITCG